MSRRLSHCFLFCHLPLQNRSKKKMEVDPTTFLSLLLLLLATLCLSYHLHRRRDRLPPSPPALPLIGHLHLLTSMPHHALARLSSRLGPILSLRLGRVPFVVVASPGLAREVLKTHDAALASRPALLSARYLSFGCSDVTFSPAGPYWRQARRLCISELLAPRRVAAFRLVRRQEIHRLLRSVASSATASSGGRSHAVDLSARFFNLANDVLCRVAFGRRFSAAGFRLPEVLVESQALFAGFTVGDFFPGLEWVNSATGLRRRLEKNRDDLSAVCDEIIADHQRRIGGPDREEEDFLDVLLRIQKSPDLEVPITDDNLKALVLDMFVAGTDTTSATLEWVMTELARHPQVMEKAQEEVRGIVGSKGIVEEDDIDQFNYMRAVIKETLRLHPPAPLLVPRESIKACVIDGYEIPAKTRVLVNAYAIGRDTQTWQNPLDFNPERFDDIDIDFKGQQDFKLLPFGGGRRGCPGYSFGLATVETTLSKLLYHFDWELPPGVGADDVDMSEIFGLATRKRQPLILIARNCQGYEFKEDEQRDSR
uniref:Tryptamine 5-hydroxylase n=1 Tax=Elaeis guineensis var. tenera TaxID=51953 RepID=A0A6I9RP37_ELAGV|nr:tryptamine 5-hydroxylase [Elaeis guineensis]